MVEPDEAQHTGEHGDRERGDPSPQAQGWAEPLAGRLRREHANASLEELGALADPPMTKDAVAGRIRRLLALADKRASELGVPDTEAAVTPEMLADAP